MSAFVISVPLPAPNRVYGVPVVQTTTLTGAVELTVISFDPTLYAASGRTIKFCCFLQTTAVAAQANLELYNNTDVATVSTLTSTATASPEYKEVTLTAPANLPNSAKVYAIRLFRSGGDVTDVVSVHNAYLQVSY